MMGRKRVVSIKLSDEAIRRVDIAAARLGMTRSSFISWLINDYYNTIRRNHERLEGWKPKRVVIYLPYRGDGDEKA